MVEIFDSNNNWKQISMGYEHVIGLSDSGELYSWGRNNQNQLGLEIMLVFGKLKVHLLN